jgi:endoglucanase
MAVALALGVIAACAGCGPSAPLALRVDDNRLVDGNGHEVRLLGVNRAGAEYACTNEHLGFFAGPTGPRAIGAMVAWGINAVRVPLNEQCWLGINGAPARASAARYRAAIRAYVLRLHAAGLYVVLDLHWNAPGRARASRQQPMADLDHAPAFWASVARAFRADPAVAFDLYNESHSISWQCWRDGCLVPGGWRTAGMQTLVDAVRSSGARQPIIATGVDWGTDLSSWLRYRPRDPANQLAAGLHVYDFSACSSPGCWTGTVEPVARSVPVVATEVGQKDCADAFLDRFTSWADSAGVSYLAWAWNPAGCDAPSLITSWDGQPTASGDRLRAHLLALRGKGWSPPQLGHEPGRLERDPPAHLRAPVHALVEGDRNLLHPEPGP